MSGFLIAASILFLPAFKNINILFNFRPWVLLILLGFIFFTHPKMSFEKLGSDGKSSHDKKSMLFINLAFYLSIIPVYYIYVFQYFTTNHIKPIHLVEIIGILLGLFGVLFRWKSIHYLGQWFTSEVVIQSDHKLVTSGPYRWIRHPGYTGALLFGLTVPLIFNIPIYMIWSAFILIPAYVYRIYVEEIALKSHFSDEYPEYKKKSWKLLPFIY
ncbi:isoprenylcysteine carboxylmethyltransferase family protein [bacterium]|nr:isoprenylcysteine carboxylmethyltransferase family protein [bacterium]